MRPLLSSLLLDQLACTVRRRSSASRRSIRPTLLALLLAPLSIAHAQTPWRQSAGPSGGSAERITISPTGPIFVACSTKVFRSIDDGVNWTIVTLPLPAFANPSVLANRAGTLLLKVDVLNVPILYRSIDEGNSWQPTRLSPYYSGIAADSVTGHFWASTVGKLYRSTDEGAEWTMITSQLGGSSLHVHDGHVFLIDSMKLKHLDVRTPDLTEVVTLPQSSTLQRYTFHEGELLVQVVQDGRHRLYRSSDLGRTWRPFESAVMLDRMRIAHGGHLFAIDRSVRGSLDGGRSWIVIRELTEALAYNDVEVTLAGTLLSTTTLGVDRSSDGGATWRQSQEGFIAGTVLGMCADSAGGVFAIMYGHEIDIARQTRSRTTDGGVSWSATGPMPARWLFSEQDEPAGYDENGILYIQGLNGLHRSSDHGMTWTAFGLVGDLRFESMAVAADTLFALTEENLYRSTDQGTSWVTVTSAPPIASWSNTVAYAPDGSILLGTGQRHYRSSDGGGTWTQTSKEVYWMQGFYARAARNGWMYFRSSFGLYRSPNGIDNWTQIWLVFGMRPARIAISGTTHLILYDSLYLSIDDGATWRVWHAGIEHEVLASIAVDARGRFYAGTYGGGVYVMDIPSSVDDRNVLPDVTPTSIGVAFVDGAVVAHGTTCRDRLRLRLVDPRGVIRASSEGRRLSVDGLAAGPYLVVLECDGVRTLHRILVDR